MNENRKFKAIKGTRDILPPDSALWNWFEQTARQVFESYGFRDLRLPIFEETELFARSIGADTDIVSKEMFTFEDRTADVPDPRRNILTAEKVGELEDALRRGEIPDTDANRNFIPLLKRRSTEMDSLAAHGSEESAPTVPKLAEFQDMAKNYVYNAQFVRLGNDVTLRPEATAGSVRAYIEHGMHTLPGNQKLYYIGPMFRRERPQKGRYRQFYQVGAEVLGPSDAPGIDAEILEMLLTLFNRVGLANTKLYINSIGCKDCRPHYVATLRDGLLKVKDSLGPDSQRRIETNTLRVLDSKLPEEQPIIETLPRISEHLCAACRDHFEKLKIELALREIAYEENWRLVRGLDYYTRTTFEVTAAGLGSQNAVCGGGRYDGLVEMLGGPAGVKGIGFAIGTDRAILSIQESGNLPPLGGLDVFIAWMGAPAYPAAVRIAKKIRARGFSAELPPEEMKFRKSLGLADKLGARFALILGEDEAATSTYTLKRLADAHQEKLGEAALLDTLEAERKGTRA